MHLCGSVLCTSECFVTSGHVNSSNLMSGSGERILPPGAPASPRLQFASVKNELETAMGEGPQSSSSWHELCFRALREPDAESITKARIVVLAKA